tara:strand:- start:89 stop:1453 length:1365 start_codon:yes stop_codon:yes gene_type:complete
MTLIPRPSGFVFALVTLLFFPAQQANSTSLTQQAVVLKMPEFTVTLPPLANVLEAREAKPLPEEFSLAQELRPLLDNGQYDAALNLLNKHSSLSPALLLVKAQLQSQKKWFDEALNTYDLVLDVMPQLVRAHQGKAIILLLQKRYKLAQAALSKAIRFGLHDTDAYTQLAYINLQINDAWSAIGAFQQALMLDADNLSLRFGLLSALIKTKQTDSAINLIESLLEKEPDNISLWLQRANLAMNTDNTDMALASLETAIRLGDKESSNYLIATQLHLQAGNYARANSLINGPVKFNQEQVTGLMPLLAQSAQWQLLDNLLKEYQPQLEQLTGIKKSRYHLYLAQLAKQNGDLAAQRKALTQSLKADPTNGQALMTLANIHRQQQNYTAAEQYYARATAIETVKRNAFLGLAQTFLDQQNYDAALENLVELSKLDPHNKDIMQNIASVKRILLARQ